MILRKFFSIFIKKRPELSRDLHIPIRKKDNSKKVRILEPSVGDTISHFYQQRISKSIYKKGFAIGIKTRGSYVVYPSQAGFASSITTDVHTVYIDFDRYKKKKKLYNYPFVANKPYFSKALLLENTDLYKLICKSNSLEAIQ